MKQTNRIFVTGASGFIGREICAKLLDVGYYLTVLRRKGSHLPYPLNSDDRVQIQSGDVMKPSTYASAMENHHAVIHLVGIIRQFPEKNITFEKLHTEATGNVLSAAIRAGVNRFLHMSALGTGRTAINPYHSTKWEAEEIVRQSKIEFTIFRPSIVYGKHDSFTNMIADMIRKYHMFPLIGGGKSKLQPIAVEDVAKGFIRALNEIHSIGRTYDIGGPEKFKFAEMVKLIAKACKTWVLTPYAPVSNMKFMAKAFGGKSWFPLTPTQLEMLMEDNVTNDKMYFTDFQIAPTPFAEGIAKYLRK